MKENCFVLSRIRISPQAHGLYFLILKPESDLTPAKL